jgi:hypothetical protein
MKKVSFLFITILLTTVFCSNPNKKDLSLSEEEYSALGLPDYAEIWNNEDYWEAYGVLAKLRNSKPYSLPQKHSEKSGKIFERIISMENFSFLEDDSLTLKEKAFLIQNHNIIQEQFVDVYTNIYGEDQYYNRELIDLYLFGLRISHKMLELAKKINASDEPEAKSLQSGYDVIKYTYFTILTDILDEQSKSTIYREDDLERLSDSISKSVQYNKDLLEVSSRKELQQKLKVVINRTSSDHILENYIKLVEVL